jgi:hypothetical protein
VTDSKKHMSTGSEKYGHMTKWFPSKNVKNKALLFSERKLHNRIISCLSTVNEHIMDIIEFDPTNPERSLC